MSFHSVNITGVLAAVAANMVIGMLWYSPRLFGGQWMKLASLSEKKIQDNNPARAMSVCLLLAAVIATVLSAYLGRSTADTFTEGAEQAFWLWTIVGSVMVIHGMFLGYKAKLMLIMVSHELVNFLVMGGIIAVLR